MNNSIYRQFHFRFRELAERSGYAFVYDSLKLMQDYIPCSEICLDILRMEDRRSETIKAKMPILSIATEKSLVTLDCFYNLYLRIPFARRAAQSLKRQLVIGKLPTPIGFDDDKETAKGIIHEFYTKALNISDVITVFGLVDTFHLSKHQETENYYIAVFGLSRNDGKRYTNQEKQLFAYCFEIFLAELKHRIKTPEDSSYLPYLLLENFKPREFASIKTCFDLKRQNQPVTRANVARFLHLNSRTDVTELELKKALDKVDYDLKKIKQVIFNDLANVTDEPTLALQAAFDWCHITDVFKIYAYFGFYPDPSHYLRSYLPTKMGEWATE